jgi:hypothetical protein
MGLFVILSLLFGLLFSCLKGGVFDDDENVGACYYSVVYYTRDEAYTVNSNLYVTNPKGKQVAGVNSQISASLQVSGLENGVVNFVVQKAEAVELNTDLISDIANNNVYAKVFSGPDGTGDELHASAGSLQGISNPCTNAPRCDLIIASMNEESEWVGHNVGIDLNGVPAGNFNGRTLSLSVGQFDIITGRASVGITPADNLNVQFDFGEGALAIWYIKSYITPAHFRSNPCNLRLPPAPTGGLSTPIFSEQASEFAQSAAIFP